ncbi:MAG: M48 family metallopeptidase [Gammaproteobacteria bacterium]|nr:M48 family metallopeptidase [Gammaproteobacteria bacterium]
MHSFTILFLAMLALSLLIRLWLSQRQISHIRAHRASVPDAFAGKIGLDEHQKAADYTVAKTRFGRLPMFYDAILLMLWTLAGGLEWLNQSALAYNLSPILTGIAVMLTFMLISSLLELPFSIYSTFVIEERFGFNRTTVRTFIIDMIKGGAVALVLGVPLLWTILWLMEKSGELWWVYAWIVWTSFSLFIMWVYPTLIAPIFNKFEPLEEGDTLNRIKQLLHRCGFSSNGIFVIDGSRRSSHGNAYFSGFGRNKRIVFFDTLLRMLNDDQLEAVLAHELGHFKKKHIIKGMLITIATSFVALALLAWIMQKDWFYTALGVSTPSTYMALLLFALVLPVFTFILHPVMSLFSRKNEFEADAFAAQQTRAEHLIHALVGLYKENASTLTPDPLYSAFYDSHPPAPVRIAHLNAQT